MNKTQDYLNEFVLVIVTILSVLVLRERADAQEAHAYKRLTIDSSVIFHGREDQWKEVEVVLKFSLCRSEKDDDCGRRGQVYLPSRESNIAIPYFHFQNTAILHFPFLSIEMCHIKRVMQRDDCAISNRRFNLNSQREITLIPSDFENKIPTFYTGSVQLSVGDLTEAPVALVYQRVRTEGGGNWEAKPSMLSLHYRYGDESLARLIDKYSYEQLNWLTRACILAGFSLFDTARTIRLEFRQNHYDGVRFDNAYGYHTDYWIHVPCK